MSEPTTQAGKRLLADVIREDDLGGVSPEAACDAILAIEAEACADLGARIEGWVIEHLWGDPQTNGIRDALLAAIREEAER